MADWAAPALDMLWQNGLAAIPLVLIAAAVTHVLPCRPATRHTIWLTVLAWLVLSPLLPSAPSFVRTSINGETKSKALATIAAPHSSAREPSIAEPAAPPLARSRREHTHLEHVSVSKNPGPSRIETASRDDWAETLPIPRSAARAASPAPEKLARALESAGPPFRGRADQYGEAKNYCELWEEGEGIEVSPFHIAPSNTRLGGRRGVGTVDRDDRTRTNSLIGNKVTSESSSGVNTSEYARPSRKARRNETARSGDARGSMDDSGPALAVTLPTDGFVPRITPISAPPISSHTSGVWREWAAGLAAVRDVFVRLPSLPRDLWLSGTALLLLIGAARVIRFRFGIRSARPAPNEVRSLVESAAAGLGLKRVPSTLMVGGRVSPMVWCGLKPRLILPNQLWSQLDDLGRRAVISHELAHIRRCDHRVTWAESIIGSLYWWHPLVWWVRSRLHAEAENCCDAWVTTLLPQTRRAYATALLRTRQYLTESSRPMPVMGIGITTGRARRFARRITMVMTGTVRPRLSMPGLALVVLIAAGGWIASPAKSCPKEDAAKDCPKKQPCPQAERVESGPSFGSKTSMAIVAPTAVELKALPALGVAELAPVIQVSDRGERSAREERVSRLQAELERLGRKIERLSKALDDRNSDADDDDVADDEDDDVDEVAPHVMRIPHVFSGHAPHVPTPPTPPTPPTRPTPPTPPTPPSPAYWHGAHGASSSPGPIPKPGQSWADVTDGETEWRMYKISKGKLEDFTKLMSRSDVPIWVRAKPEGIEIQASERQHRVMDAFLRIIDPATERSSDGWGTYDFDVNFDFGKLADSARAYSEALAQGGAWGVGCCGPCGKKCNHSCERCAKAAELKAYAEDVKARAKAEVVELRAKSRGEAERIRARVREEVDRARSRIRRHARDARSEAREHHEVIEALERQSNAFAEAAESYREQAERIRERAAEMVEKAQGDEQDAATSADPYLEHVNAMEMAAEEIERESERLGTQAEELQENARSVEEDARGLEEHANELDHRADAVREAADSINEVTPTPELVESVVALVNGIERMVTPESLEAMEQAVSAMHLERNGNFDDSDDHGDDLDEADSEPEEITASEDLEDEPSPQAASDDADEQPEPADPDDGEHDDDSD